MITITKNTIPASTIELLKRFDKRAQHNIIKNYHLRLAAKNNYKIETFDNEKGYCNGYYTNDSITDIQALELNGFKVTNCNWDSSKWHSDSFESYYNIDGSVKHDYYGSRTTPLFEHGYNRELIGSKYDGQWLYKLAELKQDNAYTQYLTCDFEVNTIRLSTNNGYYLLDNNKWYYKISFTSDYSNCTDTSIVNKIADKLSHSRYKGFYDDVVCIMRDSISLKLSKVII